MIKEIVHQGKLLALIISHRFQEQGIHFFTPGELSQQLAYMNHPKGKQIAPHIHTPVPREVEYTQEVLLIKNGQLRVDFYTPEESYLESIILEKGDVILLATGGHGFEMLTDVEMFEVKQGPYAGERDKVRFNSVESGDIKISKVN
jgi:mannose-6-phosphate isomerase-like protein (cupin superfamily)